MTGEQKTCHQKKFERRYLVIGVTPMLTGTPTPTAVKQYVDPYPTGRGQHNYVNQAQYKMSTYCIFTCIP